MHEDFRPKSEKAEVALASGPPPTRPIPVPGSGVLLQERKMSNDGGWRASPEGGRKMSMEGGRKMSIDGGRKSSMGSERRKSPEGPTGRPSMHSKSGTESSTSSPSPQVGVIPGTPVIQPDPQIVKPGPEHEESTTGFKRWFGGGKTKPNAKPQPRRRGLNQAIRTSKRLTID
ncbi:hypothetical protein OPQ81_010329 [Rhizoctonia solani]|nr:hypothetical protein OPQ81_010329 [Rhizoctonia solani]